jgi:hypothetical protein
LNFELSASLLNGGGSNGAASGPSQMAGGTPAPQKLIMNNCGAAVPTAISAEIQNSKFKIQN